MAIALLLWAGREQKKGTAMASTKKRNVGLPKKTYWHLYSLQNLEGDKFMKVINKVLKREFVLIK
ncbi:MAG: hypothetical protein AB1644_09705 [Candidatus Zixiibacteriota bacterium]